MSSNMFEGDITLLTRYFQEVDVVSVDMFKAVSAIISDSLKYAKDKPAQLVR